MKFVFKLGARCNWPVYLAALTWVTIARAGQGPANNISVVLVLCSYVAYECIPQFVLG
jgi:hypothetical protein